MSPKELLTLRLLIEYPRGLYGSQFVEISKGQLIRASIYTMLDRFIDRGLVREIDDPPTSENALPRTRHVITAKGVRKYHKFLADQGLVMQQGVFAR